MERAKTVGVSYDYNKFLEDSSDDYPHYGDWDSTTVNEDDEGVALNIVLSLAKERANQFEENKWAKDAIAKVEKGFDGVE